MDRYLLIVIIRGEESANSEGDSTSGNTAIPDEASKAEHTAGAKTGSEPKTEAEGT